MSKKPKEASQPAEGAPTGDGAAEAAKPARAARKSSGKTAPLKATKKGNTGELAARVAPLGGILSVRARLSASLEGDGKPN